MFAQGVPEHNINVSLISNTELTGKVYIMQSVQGFLWCTILRSSDSTQEGNYVVSEVVFRFVPITVTHTVIA